MCETCEVLKKCLEFEQERSRELLDTLTSIMKPKEIPAPIVNPMRVASPAGMTFTRRRAELEKADRIKKEAEKQAAKPDESILKLEEELGIPAKDSVLNTGS